MKIEYDGVYANVLKHCPLPCLRCAFFQTSACQPSMPISHYMFCSLNGLEKDLGYIFKV